MYSNESATSTHYNDYFMILIRPFLTHYKRIAMVKSVLPCSRILSLVPSPPLTVPPPPHPLYHLPAQYQAATFLTSIWWFSGRFTLLTFLHRLFVEQPKITHYLLIDIRPLWCIIPTNFSKSFSPNSYLNIVTNETLVFYNKTSV